MSDDAKRRQRSGVDEEYVIRVHDDPTDIDALAWESLRLEQRSSTPFVSIAFLRALHESKSAVADTGWAPHFMTLERGGGIVAACPLYLKDHSYGEYVFDWAWADAYRRHGIDYYPKLVDAVPFTPVPGPRLLARSHEERVLLLRGIEQLGRSAKLSSAHLLFLDENDQAAAREAGWSMRTTVQFHWVNREPTPYADFAEFLSCLQREKRKKIQQERRRVAEAGVTFTSASGDAIAKADWDFFYRCYTLTYRAHHSTPYLTRDFFARTAATMGDNWLLFVAWRDGQRIAASLIAIDPDRKAAFGRYWGRGRARQLPAFRRLLLPAARVVHRPRLPPLRRRRAGRAQDGARAHAGADLVGALARASAVRARDRRLPRARRRRHRDLHERARRAAPVQGRAYGLTSPLRRARAAL